jgi:hypothetical protein
MNISKYQSVTISPSDEARIVPGHMQDQLVLSMPGKSIYLDFGDLSDEAYIKAAEALIQVGTYMKGRLENRPTHIDF